MQKKSTQSPNKKPVQSPNKKPVQSPNKKPTQSPNKKPTQSPNKKPVQSPNKKPVQSSNKKPVQSPNKKPVQSPNKKPKRKIKGGDNTLIYNNIIIYMINHINDYIENKEIKDEEIYKIYMEDPPSLSHKMYKLHDSDEDIPSRTHIQYTHENYNGDDISKPHKYVSDIPDYDESFKFHRIYIGNKSFIIPLTRFILCFICSSLDVCNKDDNILKNTEEFIENINKIYYIILRYFNNSLSLDGFMNELEKIIPCSKHFYESIKILFTILYSNIKNSKNIRTISKLNESIRTVIRKTYDFTDTKYVVYRNLIKYRYLCSKQYFNNILNTIYSLFYSKKNKKQNGGNLFSHSVNIKNINILIKNKCNNLTTTQIYNLFKTIKEYTKDETYKFIINDIKERQEGDIKITKIMSILYLYKYTINLIFKTIIYIPFGSNIIYQFLDFIDSYITYFIVLYILGIEEIIPKIIDNILNKYIDDNELKNIIKLILQLLFVPTNINNIALNQCN